MRNFLLPLICLFCITISAQAQVTLQQDTTSFNSQMNTAFAHLKKNRVPFGILQDYAMEFTSH